MLVYERMTRHPITAAPNTPVAEALQTMRENNIRRLPVIDPKSDRLVGIVTEKELLYASPSPVTSLSIHEIHYLMSKITIDEIMTTEVVTVAEDTAIEEAALLMIDNRVGALPVMRGQQLVGIVTETDLFKTFIELFSARDAGVRLTVLVPEVRGRAGRRDPRDFRDRGQHPFAGHLSGRGHNQPPAGDQGRRGGSGNAPGHDAGPRRQGGRRARMRPSRRLLVLQPHFSRAVILSDCEGAKNLFDVHGSAVHKRDSSSLRSSE